jgi:hypothetical protein
VSELTNSVSTDLFSFNNSQDPQDILAPYPDHFESELDNSLAHFDDSHLQLVAIDQGAADAYTNFIRSESPTGQYQCRQPGPSSVISESLSGYESLSSYSKSFYLPAVTHQPVQQLEPLPADYQLPFDLDAIQMDLTNIQILEQLHAQSYGPSKPSGDIPQGITGSRSAYGSMPPSPLRPHSIMVQRRQSSVSEYAPVSHARGSYEHPSATRPLTPRGAPTRTT